MEATWKSIYPLIKGSVDNLDSLENLFRRTVSHLSTVFNAECLLIAGLETGETASLRAYATAGALAQFQNLPALDSLERLAGIDPSSPFVYQFSPSGRLPTWVSEQQDLPQVKQLPSGELLVPIVVSRLPSQERVDDAAIPTNTVQLVVQLIRSGVGSSLPADTPSLNRWSATEVESVEIVCSQIGIAYSALFWRYRLEQSRQQAALVGRIVRLLNSSLNPDEIVGRIVAELGQGLECDRCILLDLRNDPVTILAVWDHPNRSIPPFAQHQFDRALWQDVVDLFLQGGASYLQADPSDAELTSLQAWLDSIEAISVLLIPLFIQAEFFGAVALLSYRRPRDYQVDELQTIRQVADQAAIALTNAQHYQSLWFTQEALKRQNSTLQREVVRDELTQLMNRRSLERELEQLSSRAMWAVQPAFSIIICDIDYFKLVNDTHGHLVGDEVLQTLAHRLQSQLRRDTPVYRYGGEEFIVVLPTTLLAEALEVAERLRQAVRAVPIKTSTTKLSITASFGVAQQDFSKDDNAWDVIHRADQALYEAKRQGRDRVKSF